MENTALFAAKSNKEGLWECVPQHLQDTAYVMKHLCDPEIGWVSPAFSDAAGIDGNALKKICTFIAYTHDIGKLTPAFQNKISMSLQGLSERLLSHGFDIHMECPPDTFYHAFISGAILHEVFGVNDSVCEIVAAHHGIPRDIGSDFNWKKPFKKHKENILGKNGEFKTVWEDAVKKAEEISGIRCDELPQLSYAAQILLSGLLITADWVSSNENYFALSEPWDISNLEDAGRGERGYLASGIKRGWFSTTFAYAPYLFEERFGFCPNVIQETAGQAVNSGAQLLIVEGPMGSGKTEAALISAEVLAARSASGGFYIGLPTQATSNGMFSRMIHWASEASEDLFVSINLAHGGATFNDEYRRLQVNTSDETPGNLSVNRWMSGKHRKLMSDFVDGTIDQALAMSLNKKYFMLLHGQLAGKVIVLDEVHSYDAYTNAYLKTTLAYLGYYHCPTILLSATLTNEKKQEFIKAYSQKSELSFRMSDQYPCITWWDGKELHEEAIALEGLKRIKVHIQWLKNSELIEMIKTSLTYGGCAGVIRNTVKESVRTYCLLKAALPEYRIVLIHSRFLSDDRERLENTIIDLTGKNSESSKRDKLIVVGTQVLEQSLDLDFDVMFTDPCPMDLLFQRLGREHRHERTRPEFLKEAKAYLIKEDDQIIGTNDRPYNSYIINRTCELIHLKKGRISLPDDIKTMVEQTYDLTLTDDSSQKKEYVDKIQKLKINSKQMRIPEPYNCFSIRGLAQKGLSHEADEEDRGVRQGDDSVSVILLKAANGKVMDLSETVSCQIGCLPDKETESIFLRQMIRIPYYMISSDELTRMKARTGFGNEMIWAYKDILLLDDDCSYKHVLKNQIKRYCYNSEMGLMEVENDG